VAIHSLIEIAGWGVPLWTSWIAIVAAGTLCAWSIRLLVQSRSH
jgi:hypothetical protein